MRMCVFCIADNGRAPVVSSCAKSLVGEEEYCGAWGWAEVLQ